MAWAQFPRIPTENTWLTPAQASIWYSGKLAVRCLCAHDRATLLTCQQRALLWTQLDWECVCWVTAHSLPLTHGAPAITCHPLPAAWMGLQWHKYLPGSEKGYTTWTLFPKSPYEFPLVAGSFKYTWPYNNPVCLELSGQFMLPTRPD